MSEAEDNSMGTGILPVFQRQAIPPSAGLSHQSMFAVGPARSGVSNIEMRLDS
jgi:hypothetical protein